MVGFSTTIGLSRILWK